MTEVDLITRFFNLRGKSVAMAAEIASVNLKQIIVQKKDQKTGEYLLKNPLGQVPLITF